MWWRRCMRTSASSPSGEVGQDEAAGAGHAGRQQVAGAKHVTKRTPRPCFASAPLCLTPRTFRPGSAGCGATPGLATFCPATASGTGATRWVRLTDRPPWSLTRWRPSCPMTAGGEDLGQGRWEQGSMQLMPDVLACLGVCGTATFGMTVGCKVRLVVTPEQAGVCCALQFVCQYHVMRFTCDLRGSSAYYRHVPLVRPSGATVCNMLLVPLAGGWMKSGPLTWTASTLTLWTQTVGTMRWTSTT